MLLWPYAAPGHRILELGCGEGRFGLPFFSARGAELVGIDIAEAPVVLAREEAARRQLDGLAQFDVGDAHALPYESASFDLVFGTAVLHHLRIPLVMAELRRVMRPQSMAVFVEPLGSNPLMNAYRKLTPSLRTADERPLRWRDLAAITEGWRESEVRFFNLTTVFAVPLRRTRWFAPLVSRLHTLDGALFRVPTFQRLAWYSLIVVHA